jgi:predicted PurR-regulated permease PerM
MDRSHIQSLFFLSILAGTIALATIILLPYASILILAGVLAFLFSGVFGRLVRLVHSRSLAAFLTTLLVLVTVLVPLAAVGYRIAQEAADLYGSLRIEAVSGTITHLVAQLQERLGILLPTDLTVSAQDITAQVQKALGWVIGRIGPVFAGVTRLIIDFLLVLLFFFYLVRDGEKLKKTLMHLSPLPDRQERAIAKRVGQAIGATVQGQLLIAVLQGLVAGIGFSLFGVPNPVLWGSVLAVASLIPNIGTTLVQIPAIIYLAITGHPLMAIGMTLWAILVVGLLDNVLRPALLASGTQMHPLVTMLSVLGGVTAFGPIGILLGPIIASFLFALLDIYSATFA